MEGVQLETLKFSEKVAGVSRDAFQSIISIKEWVEGKTVDTRAGAVAFWSTLQEIKHSD